MPNIIMADQPSGFGLLASGDYTQASDTATMTIPVSYTGKPAFYGVKGPYLEGLSQTGAWVYVRYDLVSNIHPDAYILNTKFNENCYKSGNSGTTWAHQSNGVISVSDSAITCKQRDANYPVRAATYHWEIWGVK